MQWIPNVNKSSNCIKNVQKSLPIPVSDNSALNIRTAKIKAYPNCLREASQT